MYDEDEDKKRGFNGGARRRMMRTLIMPMNEVDIGDDDGRW